MDGKLALFFPYARHPSCGAVTCVERFGSALQLNVHFHVLVPDGAFDHDGVFVEDEAPDLNDADAYQARPQRMLDATT